MKENGSEPLIGAIARQTGFTLVELAVVVFVVALILGSILVPLSSQVEQRQFAETQRQLEEIKEAIIGFAITNGVLPCPDKTTPAGVGVQNDGQEDQSGACVATEGNLPWITLGLGTSDSWGNRFRYRVTPAYAQRTLPTFGLDTQGDNRICDLADCTRNQLTVAAASINTPVAVIVSHGPNRWGALSSDTNAIVLPSGCAAVAGCAAMSSMEQANGNPAHQVGGIRTFVARPPSPAASTDGEFDDLVIWLSPHTLKHRMVAAGKLP